MQALRSLRHGNLQASARVCGPPRNLAPRPQHSTMRCAAADWTGKGVNGDNAVTSLKSEAESRQVNGDILQLKTITGLRVGHLLIRPCVHLHPQGEHLSQARLLGGPRGRHERENILEWGLGGYAVVALRGWTVSQVSTACSQGFGLAPLWGEEQGVGLSGRQGP